MKKYFRPFVPFALIVLALFQSSPAVAGPMIVHEWGTFTSFQGGDGGLLSWQPLLTSRLPNFVYNWSRPGFASATSGLPGFGGKFTLVAKQRLETPVVYFYGADGQAVDVTVNFPQGWITEWYPRAEQVSHSGNGSFIQWSNIGLGRSDSASNPALAGDHYFTARETDSDFVKSKDEVEKFLFYRGAGNFNTPLSVSMKSDAYIVLNNTGRETISHLFVFEVNDGTGSFVSIPELKPGEEQTILAPHFRKRWYRAGDELAGKMGASMAKALVQSGLYPREAEAMVNTWKDSWFKEKGLRVFYVLPRTWTDGTLPMTLKPTPKELVRVMVGRAEILPPAVEQALVQQLKNTSLDDPAARAKVRDMLKAMGRFAQPTLNRALANAHLSSGEQARLMAFLYNSSAFE